MIPCNRRRFEHFQLEGMLVTHSSLRDFVMAGEEVCVYLEEGELVGEELQGQGGDEGREGAVGRDDDGVRHQALHT